MHSGPTNVAQRTDKNMSGDHTASYAVTDTPLPPLPDQDPLSREQWSILTAIAEGVVPPLVRHHASKTNRLLAHPLRSEVYDATVSRIKHISNTQNAAADDDDANIDAYLAEGAASSPQFKQLISRLVACHMSDTARSGLLFILSALK